MRHKLVVNARGGGLKDMRQEVIGVGIRSQGMWCVFETIAHCACNGDTLRSAERALDGQKECVRCRVDSASCMVVW